MTYGNLLILMATLFLFHNLNFDRMGMGLLPMFGFTQNIFCLSLLYMVGDFLQIFPLQCKFCERDGMIMMHPGRGKPLTQETSEARQFAPLMIFECRGYEPVDFVFGGGWKAKSVSFSSSHATFNHIAYRMNISHCT